MNLKVSIAYRSGRPWVRVQCPECGAGGANPLRYTPTCHGGCIPKVKMKAIGYDNKLYTFKEVREEFNKNKEIAPRA